MNLETWDLPVGCVLIPYLDYCEMRGEEPDPELRGRVVRVQNGEAHLLDPYPDINGVTKRA